MTESAGTVLQISASASAAIAALAGAACKAYDNLEDLPGSSHSPLLLESSKIAVVASMTLFLLGDTVACLVFGIYTIICNMQGTADTAFWQAAGILPAVCLAGRFAVAGAAAFADLRFADLAIIPLAGAAVYAESALFPEEMSRKKFISRLATAAAAAAIVWADIGGPTIRLLAAWTAGYNLLSVAWAAWEAQGDPAFAASA